MTEKIELIAVGLLQPHPRQAEIYGDIYLEKEFIASVADKGVLTPLVITNSNLFSLTEERPYTIVSGHRRWGAALQLGIREVPVIVRSYESIDDCELSFLIMNHQREKTESQKLIEFLHYKQLLCQIGKLHKGKGIYSDTVFENEEFFSLCKNLKIDPQKPLNSWEVLKEITGYSKREIERNNIIFDIDYRNRAIKKLQNLGMQLKMEEEILSEWDAVRQLVREKNANPKEAADAIKKLLDEAEALLLKKKKPKIKEPKPAPVEELEPDLFDSLFLDITGLNFTFSQMPIKFDEKQSVVDFSMKTAGGLNVGVVKSQNHPVGICLELADSLKMIDFDILERIYFENAG